VGTGRARRRWSDLALLLLTVVVVVLVALTLQSAAPDTDRLGPAERGTPDRATTAAGPDGAPDAGPAPAPTPAAGPPPATAALGDGLVADADGWYRVLVAAPDAPVRDVLNAGAPGQTAQQVQARVATVLAAAPQVVLVQVGTNDLLRGVPQETTLTAVRDILSQLQAAGVVPVLVAVPPSDALPERVDALNDALAALGRELSVVVLDVWAAARQPDGRWAPGASQDGVDPTTASSQQAAARAGEMLAAAALPSG